LKKANNACFTNKQNDTAGIIIFSLLPWLFYPGSFAFLLGSFD
jgi:chloramphenicol O-acetyltransferase